MAEFVKYHARVLLFAASEINSTILVLWLLLTCVVYIEAIFLSLLL